MSHILLNPSEILFSEWALEVKPHAQTLHLSCTTSARDQIPALPRILPVLLMGENADLALVDCRCRYLWISGQYNWRALHSMDICWSILSLCPRPLWFGHSLPSTLPFLPFSRLLYLRAIQSIAYPHCSYFVLNFWVLAPGSSDWFNLWLSISQDHPRIFRLSSLCYLDGAVCQSKVASCITQWPLVSIMREKLEKP